MNLIAWVKSTNLPVEPERLPLNGEWARFPNGTRKTWYEPAAPVTPKKIVGMGDLGELLPDEVLVELTDYQNDTGALQAIRNGATRILTRINSNQEVDVLHSDFIVLLQSLEAFTSLTMEQATEIFIALKE